jgi:hypothetical protein
VPSSGSTFRMEMPNGQPVPTSWPDTPRYPDPPQGLSGPNFMQPQQQPSGNGTPAPRNPAVPQGLSGPNFMQPQQ